MRRRALLLPVLPVLLLGLTACGGGDDGTAAKDTYLTQASEVCDRASASFAELETPTSAAGFAPFVDETISIAETAQTELAALTPPEDDRADLEGRVLDPFAALVEEGKAYSAEVEAAGDDQAALLPLLAQRPSADAIDQEYLRSYGLESCADAVADLG